MSRRAFTLFVFVLIAVGATVAAILWNQRVSRGVTVTVAPVSVGSVESTVVSSSSGTVIASAASTLIAETFGRVSAIHRDEGQRVSKGDPIIELDSREARARLDLAEANLRAGNIRFAQARTVAGIQDSVSEADVEQARARFENAASEFKRMESLRKEGIATTAQHEQATLALDLAREVLEAAKTNLERNVVRQQEIRAAEAAVDQLEAAVEISRTQLDNCFVRAPFDGLVANVFVELGESVGQSTSLATTFAPMCRLVDDRDLLVEAPIEEADIGRIDVGQRAYVTFDAYPGMIVEGTVSFVSPVVETTREQNRTVTVKVNLDGENKTGADRLPYKVGMSADLTVVVAKKDGVRYVPTNAVMHRPDGMFVYTAENGRIAKRTVEIGLANWDTSEIVAGLDDTDEVVVSLDIANLAPGLRVHSVAAGTQRQ